jgi:hypothetical protein
VLAIVHFGSVGRLWGLFERSKAPRRSLLSTVFPISRDFPASRDFDCFDSILEWDGISGMKVVFDSLIFFGRFDCLISILAEFCGSVMREVRTWEQTSEPHIYARNV